MPTPFYTLMRHLFTLKPVWDKTVTFSLGDPESQLRLVQCRVCLLIHIYPCMASFLMALCCTWDRERTSPGQVPQCRSASLRCCCWLHSLMNKQGSTPLHFHPTSQYLPPIIPGPTTNSFQFLRLSCCLTYWLKLRLCLYLDQSYPLIA